MSIATTDLKGRPIIADMSDRELLEEILATLRTGADAISEAASNPMLRAFMPKL